MGWTLLFGLAALVIAWCMFLMMMVEDPPREWDFNAFKDVPGQSIYSTVAPPVSPYKKPAPEQITPLPEGKKWEKPEKAGRSEYMQPPPAGAGK
jgi:hypothetical protein